MQTVLSSPSRTWAYPWLPEITVIRPVVERRLALLLQSEPAYSFIACGTSLPQDCEACVVLQVPHVAHPPSVQRLRGCESMEIGFLRWILREGAEAVVR